MSARARKPPSDPPSLEDLPTAIYDPNKPKLQAISMKTPDGPGRTEPSHAALPSPEPALKRPKLGGALEEARRPDNLGYLAPPRDPRQWRARRVRDIVLVVSLSMIVASIIAMVIWFAAR
jgi:hypothetical protein